MEKRSFLMLVCALSMTGLGVLTGCENKPQESAKPSDTVETSRPTDTTKPIETTIPTETSKPTETAAPMTKMNVELIGKYYRGETISVVAKDADGKEISDAKIDIIKGGSFAYSKGNQIILLGDGEVTGVISKEGYEDFPFAFTVKAVEFMSEIKSNVDEYNGKIVTVRGKITASYGNTFYLMEGKTGFYVYNMNALETTGDPGDGFENGRVLLNETVLVTAKVDNGSYGLQLVGYSDGGFIAEACVLKSNTTVTDPVLYEIKNEGELMSLSASPKLAGSRTKITGKFIKGDFSSAEQTGARDAIFDFQYGNTAYQAKFNKYGTVSTVKSYWNREKIETGDYVTIEGNFTNYKGTISIDLTDEGTTVHNESKDPNNIICVASESTVEVGKSITLSAKLPEGTEGEATFEVIKGKDNITLEGNTLTGKKPGQATIIAKLGDKQSMPIEIIITEAASTSSTISTIRDMSIGAEVTAVGKVLAFYGNGLAIRDETGYLFCIIDGEFNPMEIKIGDTVKATGFRYNFMKREIPTINNCQFEIIEKKEIQTEYAKVNQSDFKNFTDEELKYGKAVEVNLTVDRQVKVSGISKAGGYFVNDESDEPGTEYFFFSWGKKYIQPLQTSKVRAILYKKGVTAIGKPSYVLLVVDAEELIVAPESITLTLDKNTIDTHVTFGSSMTYADVELQPVGASKKDVEIVAIEGADLVEIVPDFFHDVKIKATGLPGTVKLQARTKDGKVLSNVAELTINLYVEE